MGVLTAEMRRKEAMQKIENLDLTSVKDDIVARRELQKFFQIGAIRQNKGEWTGMPACYLDTYWHRILKRDPVEYKAICKESVASPVDHVSYNGEGPWEWVPQYEEKFGSLDPIWFTDPDGTFNGPMYMEYVGTGVVKASWNCSPAIKPREEKMKAINEVATV